MSYTLSYRFNQQCEVTFSASYLETLHSNPFIPLSGQHYELTLYFNVPLSWILPAALALPIRISL